MRCSMSSSWGELPVLTQAYVVAVFCHLPLVIYTPSPEQPTTKPQAQRRRFRTAALHEREGTIPFVNTFLLLEAKQASTSLPELTANIQKTIQRHTRLHHHVHPRHPFWDEECKRTRLELVNAHRSLDPEAIRLGRKRLHNIIRGKKRQF